MDFSLPKKSDIEEQLKDVLNIMKDCHTVEDARNIEKHYGFFIEIGTKTGSCGDHCTLAKFDNVPAEEIEWFRIEGYWNLGYIYIRTDSSTVYFDIYNQGEDYAVLEDVTLNTLECRYNSYIEDIKKELLS